MSTHTPGRWFAERIHVISDYSILEDNLPTIICKATNELDARLIAAAPELLEKLEKLLRTVENNWLDQEWEPDEWECYDEFRQVIAKARGEA